MCCSIRHLVRKKEESHRLFLCHLFEKTLNFSNCLMENFWDFEAIISKSQIVLFFLFCVLFKCEHFQISFISSFNYFSLICTLSQVTGETLSCDLCYEIKTERTSVCVAL